MAKQIEKISLLCLQMQGTFGAAETDVVTADAVEVIGPATLTLNSNVTEVDLVAGSLSQDASVPGVQELDLACKAYVVSGGSDTVGQYGKLLTLSGMVQGTETPDGTFPFTFTSTQAALKDFTAWMYGGNLDASGSVLRKAYNGIFSPKWTFEAGKPTVIDLSAKLGYGGIPAAGTNPGITKQGTVPPAMLGATIKINNITTFQLLSAEIDAGQEVSLTKNAANTYGNGVSQIINRKIKWTAKCYQDLPASGDPETALLGKTPAEWEITYGAAPQKFEFKSTSGQITDVKHDDEGGVSTWTLSGVFVANDFTHSIVTK